MQVEVACFFVEVYLCRRFDADGVVEEVELVEVHFDDFLFGVVALEFDGDHPFDGLLEGAFEQSFARRSV